MAIPILGPIIGFLSTAVGGMIKLKGAQADVITGAIKTIEKAQGSTAQEVAAIAGIIKAEAQSSNFLTAAWRPILMLLFGAILCSYWFFGLEPPNGGELSPLMTELFALLKIGIGGYMGGRTIEKVFANLNLSRVIQTFIDKKVL